MYVSGGAGLAHRRDGTRFWIVGIVAMFLACMMTLFARSAWAVPSAESVNKTVPEDVFSGGLKVTKQLPLGKAEGDAVVEGTEFQIYLRYGTVMVNNIWYRSIELDGDQAVPVATIVANANGVATTGNHDLPYGTYIIRESSTPDGVRIEQRNGKAWESAPIQVHRDGVIEEVTEPVTNDPHRVSVYVLKRDDENKTAQGDASLANAEFTIYNRSKAPIRYYKNGWNTAESDIKTVAKDGVVAVIKTDADGYAELPDNSLDYGTYEAVETTPPTGYKLQEPTWTSGSIACHEPGVRQLLGTLDDLGTPENSENAAAKNPVIRGGLTIIKMDRQRNTAVPQGDAKLNAEYTVKLKSVNPVWVNGVKYQQGDDVYVGVANEVNGVLNIPANTFPYGTYEVRETKAPYGYLIDENWRYTFRIRNDGEIVKPSDSEASKNDVIRGGIRVMKVDAETGESAPQGNGDLANISIDIINASANSVYVDDTEYAPGAVVKTIKTKLMDDGTYIAETGSEDLPFGRYKLRESNVPETTGYLRNLGWNPTVVVSEQGKIAEEVVSVDTP